ncbi:hypothetical protein GCM10011331_18880 [Flavimobilis marinus]|uniref:Uncharacterized conserved protein YndB, AHSA1/START domain n=1 Tax=Flavimobilis marinus TaxID=285351 RepID=A0A1I2F152_9MICO|nr:SRPBCC domain-containing protein [Flavimobilis marinus]GHG53369.1 hypothetical protein GCM10011331_18880 [Flavimobilis marinus]SFE99072.1 Uncharacterized conserved protein YndB, AHSA1/START domain [Flavimobilis marinus]
MTAPDDGADVLRVEQAVAAPASVVWTSLTTERAAWWSEMSFDAEPGAEVVERWSEGDSEHVATGTVLSVEPERALSFEWTEPGWPTSLQVRITLHDDGPDTRLELTEEGFTALEDGTGIRAAHVEGWTMLLSQLAQHAERRETGLGGL